MIHNTLSLCGMVKCLYDRAKRLLTKPSVIARERRNIPHLYLFLTDAPPLWYRRSQRRVQSQILCLSPPRRCLELHGVRRDFFMAYTLLWKRKRTKIIPF